MYKRETPKAKIWHSGLSLHQSSRKRWRWPYIDIFAYEACRRTYQLIIFMNDLPNFVIRSSSARFSCMHANRQGATYKAFLQTQTVTFLDQSILPHSSVLPTSLHGVSLLGMALPSPARTDEVLEKIVGYEKKPTKSSLAAITYPCRHNYLHNCQTASYDHREEKSGQKVVGISDKKLCC